MEARSKGNKTAAMKMAQGLREDELDEGGSFVQVRSLSKPAKGNFFGQEQVALPETAKGSFILPNAMIQGALGGGTGPLREKGWRAAELSEDQEAAAWQEIGQEGSQPDIFAQEIRKPGKRMIDDGKQTPQEFLPTDLEENFHSQSFKNNGAQKQSKSIRRNINNIYYNTSDEEKKIQSTETRQYTQLAPALMNQTGTKNETGYHSSQQSKPQLPKNANIITGKLKASENQEGGPLIAKNQENFFNSKNISKIESQPKTLKLTQDQVQRRQDGHRVNNIKQVFYNQAELDVQTGPNSQKISPTKLMKTGLLTKKEVKQVARPNVKMLTNTTLEQQLVEMHQYQNAAHQELPATLSRLGNARMGYARGSTSGTPSETIAHSNNNSEHFQGNVFYQTQVLKKMNEFNDNQGKGGQGLKLNESRLSKEANVRTGSQEHIQTQKNVKLVKKQMNASLQRDQAEHKQSQKSKLKANIAQVEMQGDRSDKPMRQPSNRNASKKSDKLALKLNKSSVNQGIYGHSLQNTNDHTQNIRMIHAKIKNESISVNQSQEDLANSASILTGGVTLNFASQKSSKAKSTAAGHKQKISDGGVYQIMPSQGHQYQNMVERKGQSSKLNTQKSSDNNRSSLNNTQTSNLEASIHNAQNMGNLKAANTKQFFLQKKNTNQIHSFQQTGAINIQGAQSQQSHYQNMGNIQQALNPNGKGVRLQAQSQLAQLPLSSNVVTGGKPSSLQASFNKGLTKSSIKVQPGKQANSSMDREGKSKKKNAPGVQHQSLVFQRTVKQQIEQLDQMQRKLQESNDRNGMSNLQQMNMMNESAPINIQGIKQGVVSSSKQRVQVSNSIQNIFNLQEKATNQNLVDGQNPNLAYTNTLGNTLTKTIQSMSHALNVESSYANNNQEKSNPQKMQQNGQNHLRIDKNQILQFQKSQVDKRVSRSKKNSKINTVIQTIDKDEFQEEFSPAYKPYVKEDPREHSNSRNRAKSMLYTKVVPVGKFQQEGNDVQMNLASFQVQTKNKEQLLSSLENLKGLVVANTTQKIGNEIRQIHKKQKQQSAQGFNQTTKKQKERTAIVRPSTSHVAKTGTQSVFNRQTDMNFELQNLLSDPEQIENMHLDQDDQVITNINFNMDNCTNEEAEMLHDAHEGYNPENDLELFFQLQQLNDLDEAQLDDEQLVQYNDLMNIKKNLQRNIEASQQLGSTMSRQGAFRTNVPKNPMFAQHNPAKSKTVMNSFGNTLGNAMFFTNDFLHTNAKLQGSQLNENLHLAAQPAFTNHASSKGINKKSTIKQFNQVNTEIQNSTENLQQIDYQPLQQKKGVSNMKNELSQFKKRKSSLSQRKNNTTNMRRSVQPEPAQNGSSTNFKGRMTSQKQAQNLAQTDQFKFLKYMESVKAQPQNQKLDLKQAELERQVYNLMAGHNENRGGNQDYIDNARQTQTRGFAADRPKSSIAEMIANNNQIQLDHTQQKLVSHGSADGNFYIVDDGGHLPDANAQSQQHEEYQDFTNQLIQYQNPDTRNEVAGIMEHQSHGYFKFTEMLNTSQVDAFAQSQLLRHNQLDQHHPARDDGDSSFSNLALSKNNKLIKATGKQQNLRALPQPQDPRKNAQAEAIPHSQMVQGSFINKAKNLQDKRLSEQLISSTSKTNSKLQRPASSNQSANQNLLQLKNMTLQHQMQLASAVGQATNNKQLAEHQSQLDNLKFRKNSNQLQEKTLFQAIQSNQKTMAPNSCNLTLKMQMQNLNSQNPKALSINQKRLSLNSISSQHNNASLHFQETAPLPKNQANWPMTQNGTTTNMTVNYKKAKIARNMKPVRDQSRSSQRQGQEMNDQKHLMNTLINFYTNKQAKLGGKKPNTNNNTQKLQGKDTVGLNNTAFANELYHKGIRNSSSSAMSKQSQAKNQRPTSQLNPQQPYVRTGLNRINLMGAMNYGSQEEVRVRSNSKSGKKQTLRASSEHRSKGGRTQSGARAKQNHAAPLSLGNTSGKLAQDLKSLNTRHQGKGIQLGSTAGVGQLGGIGQIQAMLNNQKVEAYQYNNYSGNRSSFLGTLKGGLGIMGNISNNEDENFELTKNELAFNTGKILNIENVLNQLNQQTELSKDQNEQLKQYLNSSQNNILIDEMDKIQFPERHSVSGQVFNQEDDEGNLLFNGITSPLEQIQQEILEQQAMELPEGQNSQEIKQMGHQRKLRQQATGQRENSAQNKTQPIPKQIIREIGQEQRKNLLKNALKNPKAPLHLQKLKMKNLSSGYQGQELAAQTVPEENEGSEPVRSRDTSRGHLQKMQMRQLSNFQSRQSQKSRPGDKGSQVSQGSVKSMKQGEQRQSYYNPSGEELAAYKSQPKIKQKLNASGLMLKTNATELDLRDGDGPGSRVPGGETLIPGANAQVGSQLVAGPQADQKKAPGANDKQSPSAAAGSKGEIALPASQIPHALPETTEVPKLANKKRVEYINQLKDDLDNKIKQRYGYANLQQKNNAMSQSNNLILIDYNSAHNPSNMGDNDETQSENRVHNYAFGRQIGEGAYAVVRIATSREDNKKYAIKVYDKTKLSDINRQRSVRREVVLLQKMNHEHIVKLVEAFETDSHVYLVMEHVSGGSLHSYLKEMINKQLDEEEGRRIFKQILVALRYCHSKCIAHRDIKLENILLDENKNVKLIDFGFSTCIPNNKKIRMYCGTPSYMSPQIVTKVEYAGPPADVWAAGVLLYALLNGCFPFRGQTDDDLYRRIKRGTYHIHNQKVTHDYLEMLQRCLDPNDDTRASAQDLLDDPWFKIEDIRQKAYDEEKRQFKARILAKVPIIKKSNHTICILAQNKNEKKEDQADEQPAKKRDGAQHLQIVSSNEKQVFQPSKDSSENFPYVNSHAKNQPKGELVLSDYGFQVAHDRDRDKEKLGAIGQRENFINKLNNTQQVESQPGNQGAIVLSYGAAVAPQIQINNISNLNLINSNMKKKLNHEAYQAYYNTSSSNATFATNPVGCINLMNIQSSPMAGPTSHGQKQNSVQINAAKSSSSQIANLTNTNVYGQEQLYNPGNSGQPSQAMAQNQNIIKSIAKNKASSSGSGSRPGAENQSPSSRSNNPAQSSASSLEQLNNKLNINTGGVPGVGAGGFGGPIGSQRGGAGGQGSVATVASVQSSPYTSSSYHLQIMNNQMAQLHQLQLDLQAEKEQKEQLMRQLELEEAKNANRESRQISAESGGSGEDSGEQGGSSALHEEPEQEANTQPTSCRANTEPPREVPTNISYPEP